MRFVRGAFSVFGTCSRMLILFFAPFLLGGFQILICSFDAVMVCWFSEALFFHEDGV